MRAGSSLALPLHLFPVLTPVLIFVLLPLFLLRSSCFGVVRWCGLLVWFGSVGLILVWFYLFFVVGVVLLFGPLFLVVLGWLLHWLAVLGLASTVLPAARAARIYIVGGCIWCVSFGSILFFWHCCIFLSSFVRDGRKHHCETYWVSSA